MIQPSTVDCLQRLQSRSSDASPTGLPNVVSRDRAQGLRAQGLVQAEAIEAGELLKLQRWQRRQQLAAGVTPLFDQPPPKFEQLTPMLVMPFTQFKAQGRIMKSTKVWRDEALATGALVMWWEQKGGDKIVIFISHTWWDRGVRTRPASPCVCSGHTEVRLRTSAAHSPSGKRCECSGGKPGRQASGSLIST